MNWFDEIVLTCNRLGLPGFAPYLQVRFVDRPQWWNREKGIWETKRSIVATANGIGTIQISNSFWRKLTDGEKIQVIRHEVCHVVDALYAGVGGVVEGHGPPWRRLMVRCGAPPEQYLVVKEDNKILEALCAFAPLIFVLIVLGFMVYYN